MELDVTTALMIRTDQALQLCGEHGCILTTAEDAALRQWLQAAGDWDLFRVNPLKLAEDLRIDVGRLVDFFVAGVQAGLFNLQLNVICPGCGGVEYTHVSIGELNQRLFRCTICDIDISADLDDQIEASFTLNEAVRQLAVSPFASVNDYHRFFFSQNYRHSDEFSAYFRANMRGFLVAAPGQTASLSLPAVPGAHYRLTSMVRHTAASVHCAGGDATSEVSEVRLTIDRSGFSRSDQNAGAGPLMLHISNQAENPLALTVTQTEHERVAEILAAHPHRKRRFLTAKDLISRQIYRELFRDHDLPRDFNLNIRSLTLLFTDLKGSTQLYEESGDLAAFHIVQEHFSILKQAVRECGGAIVKTMGDAVMASFPDPLSAFQGALMILSRTSGFWEQHKIPKMGIKIGLHEGAALAVSDEGRIDYFGQTVNTAARIQGQAHAGEILFSEGVYKESAIRNLLRSEGCSLEMEHLALKGLKQPVPVYRLHFRA